MDGQQFDDLARAWVENTLARRNVLRILASGALGWLGWHGLEDAQAHDLLTKCKKFTGKKKKACVKKAKQHAAQHANEAPAPDPGGGNSPPCVPNCTGKDCGNNGCGESCGTCAGGKECVADRCKCPDGFGDCAGLGICGSLEGDNNHCGTCNNACPRAKVCRGGKCVCDERLCSADCACPGNFYCHNGGCVCDPYVFCGNDCPCPATGGEVCINRGCRCDGKRCGTFCKCEDFSDYKICQNGECVCPDHLPACGNDCCIGGKVCKNGACVCDGTRCSWGGCTCPSGKTCSDLYNGECVCDGTRCDNGCACSGAKVCDTATGTCECDGTRCDSVCGCTNEGDGCFGGICRPII